MKQKYSLKGDVWIWRPTPDRYGDLKGTWHFVSVDKKTSAEIKENYKGPRRGFGSVRVKATIGKTSWSTSIFPDKKSGAYVLPIKAEVRRREDIGEGDTLSFSIEIR